MKKGLEKCDGSWYREEDDDKMEQNTVRKANKPLPMVTGKKGVEHTQRWNETLDVPIEVRTVVERDKLEKLTSECFRCFPVHGQQHSL